MISGKPQLSKTPVVATASICSSEKHRPFICQNAKGVLSKTQNGLESDFCVLRFAKIFLALPKIFRGPKICPFCQKWSFLTKTPFFAVSEKKHAGTGCFQKSEFSDFRFWGDQMAFRPF